jgi:hypothetical protein
MLRFGQDYLISHRPFVLVMERLLKTFSITDSTGVVSFSGEVGDQSEEIGSPILESFVLLHPLLCILTNN